MFEKLKNLDIKFRQVRWITFVFAAFCLLISLYAIYTSYHHAAQAEQRIYILANGRALEAFAADHKDNIPVEARDHIRGFHELFFSLEPDEKVITANMGRAFYLGDGSIRRLYDNLKEAGFFAGIISANISQTVSVDSISLDMDAYPYRFKCFSTEKFIRATTITTRSLVTAGALRNTARSDNNPHGFLIERLEVIDNKDLTIKNRSL